MYVRRTPFAEFDDLACVSVGTAPQTLLELARDLTLVDLVPMVDCALREGTQPEDILGAARPRAQGAARLRQALALADPRSESWWETVLRLLHMLTGLGALECQAELWERGLFVARADLPIWGATGPADNQKAPRVAGGAD